MAVLCNASRLGAPWEPPASQRSTSRPMRQRRWPRRGRGERTAAARCPRVMAAAGGADEHGRVGASSRWLASAYASLALAVLSACGSRRAAGIIPSLVRRDDRGSSVDRCSALECAARVEKQRGLAYGLWS
ncbi:hypothetical protein AB1Y20_023435 [Prymnesium parvum]|uniref:Uncharacterized protein n=1 Tax=Prymnesium parvum TaxID=97485 RepID=A0AB34JEM6_PRYPA|mmetsp:Transcript_21389/g.53345  ORF Transcript_21389/g.53345 Transcript_21389/m.53345 type:complete len:131 (+) Transcript_21389:249-641(+)